MIQIIAAVDSDLASALIDERRRQDESIELIASENIASDAVMTALGSIFTNKYAEGYPGRRYYAGCGPSDKVEELAIAYAKRVFGCAFANVQPHSGSSANAAVFMALMRPGDTLLGMGLDAGGHLTHGSPVNFSGKWFTAHAYGLDTTTGLIDYEAVAETARRVRPKLLIAGGSAYPMEIDFARLRAIADDVGAVLLADIAHYAGLVAAGLYPNPFPHAHVVTTTTHKTLRGPRGGMILTNDPDLAKRIDQAVFPGLQGGPMMNVIAAKAIALREAIHPDFKRYALQVKINAGVLADGLRARGLDLVCGGTQSHLVLVDLRALGVTGAALESALLRAGLTTNKNAVPADPQGPRVTSGLRLGSPAGTSRGFHGVDFAMIADMVADVAHAVARGDAEATIRATSEERRRLTAQFPIDRRPQIRFD